MYHLVGAAALEHGAVVSVLPGALLGHGAHVL